MIKTFTIDTDKWRVVPVEPTEIMKQAAITEGCKRSITDAYSHADCYRAMIAVATQPEPVDVEPVIDLEHVAYSRLVEAACNSKWIPKEYYANDWISDCVDFLINGHPPADAGRVAELEKALKVARDALNTCTHEGFCDYDDATDALAKINEVLE